MNKFMKPITTTKHFVIRHKTPIIAVGAAAGLIVTTALITANVLDVSDIVATSDAYKGAFETAEDFIMTNCDFQDYMTFVWDS